MPLYQVQGGTPYKPTALSGLGEALQSYMLGKQQYQQQQWLQQQRQQQITSAPIEDALKQAQAQYYQAHAQSLLNPQEKSAYSPMPGWMQGMTPEQIAQYQQRQITGTPTKPNVFMRDSYDPNKKQVVSNLITFDPATNEVKQFELGLSKENYSAPETPKIMLGKDNFYYKYDNKTGDWSKTNLEGPEKKESTTPYKDMSSEEQKAYRNKLAGLTEETDKPLTTYQKATLSNNLRKEFNADAIYKNFNEIQRAERAITVAYQTSVDPNIKSKIASDQTLVMEFNRMLDPDSVVRESEFARTPENAGMLQRMRGWTDQIIKGGLSISNADRKAILDMAQKLIVEEKKTMNAHIDRYTQIANDSGIKPELVFGTIAKFPVAGTQSTAQPKNILVTDKNGKLYLLPSSELDEAIKQGYKQVVK